MLQTSENQLYHGKHPICQTSEKPKCAGNIRKANFPGQKSKMSNFRKTKKCCKYAKTSFTMANIRYVKHPKNQKVLQTSENRLYQGEHPIYQTSVKPKSAANIRKPALPWQTSDMSNIRKTKRCWMLETSENQFFQGKHPICQTSEKPKNAANMRKPALLWQTSDMSNIRKTKKCCKHPKTGFTRANIRYIKHPVTQNCCKHPKISFTLANIQYAKHPKNQKVLQTSKKQLFQGKHPISQTSEKTKSAANMRKPALPGQTSDISNI